MRFIHEAFCRMRPGVPLAELHGKIKQEKRMHIFQDFLARKEAVLFATDIAARGLDFPSVDWVVQVQPLPHTLHPTWILPPLPRPSGSSGAT